MRFRAVLFDAGETLVHVDPTFPGLFSQVLSREGIERDAADVQVASKAVFHRFSEAAAEKDLWTTSPEKSARFWKGVYVRMLEALGLPSSDGLPDRLYETFTDLENYALFDDVRPVLTELAPRALLGVVSNFEPWLDDLLLTRGVRDMFTVCVISGNVGIEKPDPRIYEIALQEAGVAARDAAYVGDNPEFDVWPAIEVGMTPVLVDRRGRFPDHHGPRITDLHDLPAVLETL